eukprot:430400-Prymnesium_polylepis.1
MRDALRRERLPCGVLPASVDVCEDDGSSAPLGLERARPAPDASFEKQVGGCSSASPEVVLCGKRDECYAQGLCDAEGEPLPVIRQQRLADGYWTER